MMSKAEVRVIKQGPQGRPVAQLSVSEDISGEALGQLVHKVVTNESVLGAAGLRACLGCKSGLDVNVVDGFGDTFHVEV